MGMGVFTGRFDNFDVGFAVLALSFCVLGRFLNIFPLSWIANRCRNENNRISIKMQCVLWFAGLRGAIAFALAMNMPGNHRDVYATATLFICIFTTVVCGGLTDRTLAHFEMKQAIDDDATSDGLSVGISSSRPGSEVRSKKASPTSRNRPDYSLTHRTRRHVYKGVKRIWKQLDNDVLKVYFGGSTSVEMANRNDDNSLGNYELGQQYSYSDSDDDDDDREYRKPNGVH